MREITDNAWWAVRSSREEADMDRGSAAAKFGVLYCNSRWPSGGAPEEGQVEGYGMRLVLRGESCAEVQASCRQDAGGHEAAMGNCERR